MSFSVDNFIKSNKPTTPSMRFYKSVRKNYVDNSSLIRVKYLLEKKISSSGRDNHGHITSRFRGSGHKSMYRVIKFKWLNSDLGSSYKVVQFEYDPNRNVEIALMKCISTVNLGKFCYIIRPEGLKVEDIVNVAKELSELSVGNVAQLKNIPIGTNVHCVEMSPFGGAIIARSAGSYANISGRDDGYVILKMPSGEIRKVNESCLASVGFVANGQFFNSVIGKAGRNRWLGKRPHVRGVAMNPVDHPLGGGEGKTSGGRHPVSPWGKNCKGKKTRNNKRTNVFVLVDRRNVKRK